MEGCYYIYSMKCQLAFALYDYVHGYGNAKLDLIYVYLIMHVLKRS